MDAMNDVTLDFLVAVDEEESADGVGEMGIFHRRSGDVEIRSVPIPVQRFRENLVRACGTLVGVLEEVGKETSGMKLREAQIHFEVSASGGVQFVGTAEVKGAGGITLVFRE
jgi:hypothetical protein